MCILSVITKPGNDNIISKYQYMYEEFIINITETIMSIHRKPPKFKL